MEQTLENYDIVLSGQLEGFALSFHYSGAS